MSIRICILKTVAVLLASVAFANHHGGAHLGGGHHQQMVAHGSTATPGAAGADSSARPAEQFVSTHTIEVDGDVLRYKAVAEEIFLRDPSGSPTASIFAISYQRAGLADPATRPLTFVFNGGPGSSSVWLHLGAFGPHRLVLDQTELQATAAPYRLSDNQSTLLTHTDLVFVDPVGTGSSRALNGSSGTDFWGVDEDAAAMASFVREYLTRYERWRSPKFLAGESYGSIRAAFILRDLSLDLLNGVAFNGVILLGSALDARLFQSGSVGNELPYVTNLPTYAATAAYHQQLPEPPNDLDAFLREVRSFAADEYLPALFRGAALPSDERARIAARLHRYTGLSEQFLLDSELRIGTQPFLEELLRSRGEVVGHHDTRYRGPAAGGIGDATHQDPFLAALSSPFVTTINSYLTEELGVRMDREYRVFNQSAYFSWKRPASQNHAFSGYLQAMPALARVARSSPDFGIFVVSGLHDLTTTFFGVEYSFDQSGIDQSQITLRNYSGGHMMYLEDSSLRRLAGEVREFIAAH